MAGKLRGKSNTGLKIVSVLLAVLLWLYIANQTPGNTNLNTTGVNLRYTNLGDGLMVNGPERVAVRLWGSFSETGEIVAYVDLSGLGEGSYHLPVQVKPVKGAMLASVQPDKVDVVLKRTNKHEFRVGYRILQNPPAGYQLLDVAFVPDRCLVTGEDAALKRVSRVVSLLQLGNTTQNAAFKAKLIALDSAGNQIDKGIRLTPSQLEVYAVVTPKRTSKKVNVKPVFQGKLPEGYQVGETRIEPADISILGKEDAVNPINEIGTKEISLEGRKQSFTQEVGLQDLKDVKAYPSRVMVEVVIINSGDDAY